MMDQETESLWSQILGRAMRGELEGTELEMLPAEMITWEAWLRDHPDTTVLDLRRTSKMFEADFYRRPADFSYAWTSGFRAYSITFDVLLEHPVINLIIDGWPLVVTFDVESTAAHLLSRRIDGMELYFVSEGESRMSDKQTGTVWNQNTGIALEGPLKGKSLEHQAGTVTYTDAWQEFHPNNITLDQADDVGVE